jgi:hypothetical protein
MIAFPPGLRDWLFLVAYLLFQHPTNNKTVSEQRDLSLSISSSEQALEDNTTLIPIRLQVTMQKSKNIETKKGGNRTQLIVPIPKRIDSQ